MYSQPSLYLLGVLIFTHFLFALWFIASSSSPFFFFHGLIILLQRFKFSFLPFLFHFFPLGLVVFDVFSHLCFHFFAISFLSQLLQFLLLYFKLHWLVVVAPRDGLWIDFWLLKILNFFPQNFFDPWYPEQIKRLGCEPDVDIFELENIFQIVFFVWSNVGNKCFFALLDKVSISEDQFMNFLSDCFNPLTEFIVSFDKMRRRFYELDTHTFVP